MEKIQELAFQLHDKLLNSDEYNLMKEKEKNMLDNQESSFLLKLYNDAMLEYGANKTQENLKKMHLAKLKMDENSLVAEYKAAYKNYQILVGHITEIVFEGFQKTTLIDKIIRAK